MIFIFCLFLYNPDDIGKLGDKIFWAPHTDIILKRCNLDDKEENDVEISLKIISKCLNRTYKDFKHTNTTNMSFLNCTVRFKVKVV